MTRLRLALGFLLALAGSACAQSERVFFGNLHSHTSYSDGSGTPDEAYLHARDVAGLDFLAITEHNHDQAEAGAGARADGLMIATDHALYNGPPGSPRISLIEAARAANVPGRFVALYGQEFSTISAGNHVNVFQVGEVIDVDKGRFDGLLDWLSTRPDSQGLPAILMFNHPSSRLRPTVEYGRDDFGGDAEWVRRVGAHASLIQIINGPGTRDGTGLPVPAPRMADFKHYLNLGFRLAPTADQDNHHRNWGDATRARTAVITTDLTVGHVLGAMRARRVYATTDPNLRIIVRVNGGLCGDVLPVPSVGSELAIEIEVHDDDEPEAFYEVEVFSDVPGGEVARAVDLVALADGNGTYRIEDIRATGEGQYVFFRIEQFDEDEGSDLACTAPVWFSPGVSAPAHSFVASKNSRIFHIDPRCADARAIKDSNKVFGEEARSGRRQHEGCPR